MLHLTEAQTHFKGSTERYLDSITIWRGVLIKDDYLKYFIRDEGNDH